MIEQLLPPDVVAIEAIDEPDRQRRTRPISVDSPGVPTSPYDYLVAFTRIAGTTQRRKAAPRHAVSSDAPLKPSPRRP